MHSNSTCLRRLPGLLLLATLTFLARPAAAGVDRWTPIGPEGGEIVTLAADPDAPDTLYLGTAAGGVWKSLDGGASWAPLVEGLGAAPISTLAVTAGRVFAGSYLLDSLRVLTAGASQWRRVGPAPFSVGSFAVDPTDPAKVWMTGTSSNGDLLTSNDAGENWELKLRIYYSFSDVTVAPTVPPTVYAGGDEGLFASRNGGTTWHQFDAGNEPPWQAPLLPGDLAVDPQDAETLYVAAYAGFWRTADGGAHWLQTTEDSRYHLLAFPGALLGFNNGRLERSDDRGESWEPVEPAPWRDFSCLAADPAEPGAAWVGGSGGLFHTSDLGRSWERRPLRGLSASVIRAFAFDPFRPRTLYAATPTAGLQRSADGGGSWGPTLTRMDIRSLAADPRRPAALYAGTPRGVSASRDRGAHWQTLLREPLGINTVSVDPRRSGTIWAAGKKIWRSRDAGLTWKQMPSPFEPASGAMASKIFLSPWHPETLYLIVTPYFLDLHDPGALWRSTDSGATWEVLDNSFVADLAFDPVKKDFLYLADFSGSIRKSRDGGTTWEPVASSAAGGSSLSALLVDRTDPSVLYAGSWGNGVWRSLDQGVTWQPFSAGLIGPAVSCLEADPRNPRRLIACTRGGGLLEIVISP
jgi:photosystem II stability/assembly factor-like uncharacterized protein